MTETLLENKLRSNSRLLAMYRTISLALAAAFAVVGLMFLFLPGDVLRFFNDLAPSVRLEATPVDGTGFYLVLAVGYMYVVTLLAWYMYRQPANRVVAVLLANAKLTSSILSIVLFLTVSHALIYIVNGITDGIIGIGVFVMHRWQRRFE